MVRKAYFMVMLGLLAACSITPVAHAYVVLAEELWDAGTAGSPTWGSDQPYVTVGHSDGVGEGYLNVQYDPSRGPGEAESIVYTDADVFFAGAWDQASQDGAWIAFDFWADDYTPYDFELQFQGTSGDVWRYDLSTASLGAGWASFTASMAYNASSWAYGAGAGGSEAIFLSDLQTINWIGLYIYDDVTDANNYGLDNWQLMVPEPTEYALAFSALAVTWLSLRRKRKPVCVQAA